MTRARWAIAAAGVAAIVIAAVVVGLLGGTGGDDRAERTAPSPASPGGLSFEGGALPGTLYLSGGSDPLNADLYRVRGNLSSTAQITREGRISGVTAYGDTVVVSDARGSGSDRLERLNLRSRNALPGSVLDPEGQGPAFSSTGKLLYSVPQYASDGEVRGDKVIVANASGGDRRQVLLSRRDNMNWGWGPGGRVAGFRDGSSELLLDPEGPRETAIRAGIGRVGDFQTAANDTLAVLGPRDAISIVRPGAAKPTVLRTDWVALAWAPDSRSLLATRNGRIGLMNPSTGAVRTVGSVRGGKLFAASWVADESPTQPES